MPMSLKKIKPGTETTQHAAEEQMGGGGRGEVS